MSDFGYLPKLHGQRCEMTSNHYTAAGSRSPSVQRQFSILSNVKLQKIKKILGILGYRIYGIMVSI